MRSAALLREPLAHAAGDSSRELRRRHDGRLTAHPLEQGPPVDQREQSVSAGTHVTRREHHAARVWACRAHRRVAFMARGYQRAVVGIGVRYDHVGVARRGDPVGLAAHRTSSA
jgi:hypothetical protein